MDKTDIPVNTGPMISPLEFFAGIEIINATFLGLIYAEEKDERRESIPINELIEMSANTKKFLASSHKGLTRVSLKKANIVFKVSKYSIAINVILTLLLLIYCLKLPQEVYIISADTIETASAVLLTLGILSFFVYKERLAIYTFYYKHYKLQSIFKK